MATNTPAIKRHNKHARAGSYRKAVVLKCTPPMLESNYAPGMVVNVQYARLHHNSTCEDGQWHSMFTLGTRTRIGFMPEPTDGYCYVFEGIHIELL